MEGSKWRKPERSNAQGNCAEVGEGEGGGVILVRDTKNRAGAMLSFHRQVWRTFAATVKDDTFTAGVSQ